MPGDITNAGLTIPNQAFNSQIRNSVTQSQTSDQLYPFKPSTTNLPGHLISTLDEWRQHLIKIQCPQCKAVTHNGAETMVSRMVGQFKKAEEAHGTYIHPWHQCFSCHSWFCSHCHLLGKLHTPSPQYLMVGTVGKSQFKVGWCCDGGRMFLLWSLLCGPENKSTVQGPTGSKQSDTGSFSKPDKTSGSLASKIANSHYETKSKLPKGIGYGGAELSEPVSAKKRLHDDKDVMYATYMAVLALVFPDRTRTANMSYMTELDKLAKIPVLAEMVRRSPLLFKADEWLHNDSIDEIITQHGIYHPLLSFLNCIISNTDTDGLIHLNLPRYALESQLVHATFTGQSLTKVRDARTTGTMLPLVVLIGRLDIPSLIFLQTASSHTADFQSSTEDGEALGLVKLIRTVCDKSMQLDKEHAKSQQATGPVPLMPVANPRGPVTRAMSNKQADQVKGEEDDKARKEAIAFHRANCVKELDDNIILEGFYYKKDALAIEKLAPKPGRMKKLVSQVASLHRDLPEGIYVRHGESRLDCLKVLIVGPQGTPYENGLFEFDLFCPVDFPQSNPSIQFKTTGGGKAHFNPNLYHNGKVCLSLVGTWRGPKWDPTVSSILQVLVSIQGM